MLDLHGPDFHGYGVYIWPAYGVAAVIIAGLVVASVWRHRRLLNKKACLKPMTRKQQRLYAVGLILLGVIVATGLALFALRDTVTFFYTPSDIKGVHAKFIAPGRPFRLGGLVEKGSLHHEGDAITFTVTDTRQSINVTYDGIVPDLFRENSGVVAMGRMNADGTFTATQLLAKHDSNYMPPEVARALKKMPHYQSVIPAKAGIHVSP